MPNPTLQPTSATTPEQLLSRARAVLDVEIEGLEALKRQLDGEFFKAIELLEHAKGRVVVTGMGKSGLVGKKIAATLSSTGTPSYFLHPAEGSHGDLGLLMPGDTVIAISNSGETPELLAILPLVKRLELPMIAMTGKTASTLARRADAVLNIAVPQEACPINMAPTTSTTATLAMGDTLAVVLMERKRFSEEDFALVHPAGALGKRLLLKVADMMHMGENLPIVHPKTSFLDALLEMSRKKLGLTLILNDAGEMLGILTDGDVRRALTHEPNPQQICLIDVMTRQPKTVAAQAMAVDALRLMESHKITALVCVDDDERPVGVIHLHELLNTGLR